MRGFNRNFKEEDLFDQVEDFSWGIQSRQKLLKNGQETPTMIFLPMYSALGQDLTNLDIIGFGMKFYKPIDDNNNNCSLIKLKLVTVLSEEDNWGSKDDDNTEIGYNLEFEVESIRGITMIEKDSESDHFTMYINVKYLPEVFKITKKYHDDEQKNYSQNVQKVRSPLWNTNLIRNCLNNHLIFRVKGLINNRSKPTFCQEFSQILNTTGVSYVNIPDDQERLMSKRFANLLDGEEPYNEFKEKLDDLPFAVQYIIYSQICNRSIHLLLHSYEELLEFITYIHACCYSDEDRDYLHKLQFAIQVFRSIDCSNTTAKEHLKFDHERLKDTPIASFKAEKCVTVRRIVITPSTIQFNVPTRNMWNRVIRKFENNLDDFIRVSFQSERHGPERYNNATTDSLVEHIKKIMTDGFAIKDKNFKFLHYSNSQMKAHSCWFINEVGDLTYERVIESLGDFKKEKKLSKNASRKGQAFSSAIKVATLDCNTEIEEIEDIEHNGYTFSDGCGEIKASFATQIAREKFGVVNCTAFQIRLGGCKGVLVSSKNSFEGDVKVKIRKSMKKFDQNPDEIEIDLDVIRMATFSQGYLNKQIISILWANGVEPEVFLEMQEKYVEKINSIYDLESMALRNDSDRYMLYSSIRHIDYKLFTLGNVSKEIFKDPFIGPLFKLVCYSKFRELRKRFRIYDKKCCVLIGVIDPYDCLEENEVHVQYSMHLHDVKGKGFKHFGEIKPVEGDVLVSRNPCVHNGDIRKLKAVKKPELDGYTNVIVFSARGKRPQHDKMASGDLDGDIYWINWREEFLEQFIEQPPNGQSEEEKKEKAPNISLNQSINESLNQSLETSFIAGDSTSRVTRDQCIMNFINYIRNDLLGEVANLHSKIADTSRKAITESDCLALAEMHSKAVDFQKHGELLNVQEFEDIKDSNAYYVDFMSHDLKNFKIKKMVESPGVLGTLYRALKDNIDPKTFLQVEYDSKILRKYELPESILNDISIFRHLVFLYKEVVKPYQREIHKIMEEKNLFTESDIFNVNCAFTNLINARDEKYGHEDDIEIILLGLKEQLRHTVLDTYCKSMKKVVKQNTRDLRQSVFKSLKFASYFELHHKDTFDSDIFEVNEGDNEEKAEEKKEAKAHFEEFISLLEKEKIDQEEISFKDYYHIVTDSDSYTEEQELKKVISRVKIFSAWWMLTQYN